MGIYISTGGFSELSADKTSEQLIAMGISSIELSGGKFSKDILENLDKLKKKANFQIHNYFPPPSIPFVLNLASQDKEVSKLSLNHVDRALDCCAKLHAKYYSFHAGFLCDLKISEIGRQIKKRKLYNRKKSIELFLERILSIWSNHPVVPTTTGTFDLQQCKMFSKALSGRVNSMATSEFINS